MNSIHGFWDWVDRRHIIRRLVLLFTLIMTYFAFYESYAFAILRPPLFDGVGTAAIIAAFTAPVVFLQKAVFDAYLGGKGKPE